MASSCSLCAIDLSHFPIVDGENRFCCTGCQAVYNILVTKKLLDNYQETSVFKQALKAGLISNPSLLEQIRSHKIETQPHELEKLHLEISDMWCPSCAEVIKLILLQQKGIVNCIVDYTTDLASVEFSPRYIAKEKIRDTIISIGYEANTLENSHSKKISLSLYMRFGIAAFCALNAMMFAYPLYATYFDAQTHKEGEIFAWLTFFSSLPVITYCMWPILKRFISSLKIGLLGMEALVVMGVCAAFGLSLYELILGSNLVYFDSMSVIIALVLFGKIIETKAKFSAKESLFRLSKALPRRGRKYFNDGTTDYVPIKDILEGDIVIAYAGEKIILDGEVISGEGTCDESLMTGESLPIAKKTSSKLLGGSILQFGALTYKVLNQIQDSVLQKIINVVAQDLGHKSNYVRAADKIVRWFVPLVFFISAATWLFGWILNDESSLIKAVAVLLIACPCAIGIAAPLAESQILHQLASFGIIIRNRGCLALLPYVSTFVFDKTGTVTEGQFKVLSGLSNLSSQEKALLKALSKPSNHLICRALFKAIDSECTNLDYVEECAGKGMRGFFFNKTILLGSAQFIKECMGILLDSHSDAETVVYFSPDGIKIHKILLGDTIRPEVPEVTSLLQKFGAKTVMLSGDAQGTVTATAKHCGFQEYFYEINPLQKRDFIENLRNKGEVVCMIGDGINDAPALTASQIGISVVSATDISIQVSDILLTTEHLKVLPKMLSLVTFGQSIIKQNMFWAFFYNCLGIGLATYGLLSPIYAAFAMTASSLIVLFNSKRIKYPLE